MMKQFPVRDKVNILPSDGTIKSWDSKELMRRYLMVGKAFDKFESEAREFTDELVKDNARMSRELKEAENKLLKLESSLTFYITDEETKRVILKLYAMGNGISTIHRTMTETKHMDVTVETVRDIITNLNNRDLPAEDIEYFNKEVEIFNNDMVFNEEKMRVDMIRRITENQARIDEIIAEISSKGLDDEEIAKIGQLMALFKLSGENVKNLSTVMKGVGGNSDVAVIESIHKDTDKFEKQAIDAFLSFDDAEVKTIEMG